MKITDTRKNYLKRFDTLEVGTFFEYDDTLFIKAELNFSGAALCMEDNRSYELGRATVFEAYELVLPVEAELFIS